MKELKKINKTIEQVFLAICFKKGAPPNMHRLIPLFIENGILINYNQEQPLILPVRDFVDHFEQQVKNGIITELEDKEVHSETKIYGKIAHRYSFYEAKFKQSDQVPFAVGVNSIQLIKLEGKWKVTSMAWNDDLGLGFFKNR